MKKLNHSTHSIHLNESIHKENYSHLLEEANHNNVIKQYNKNELFQAEHDILDYVNKLKRKTILSIDEGNAPPIKPKSRNSALTINSHQIDPTNKIKLQKISDKNVDKAFSRRMSYNINRVFSHKKQGSDKSRDWFKTKDYSHRSKENKYKSALKNKNDKEQENIRKNDGRESVRKHDHKDSFKKKYGDEDSINKKSKHKDSLIRKYGDEDSIKENMEMKIV